MMHGLLESDASFLGVLAADFDEQREHAKAAVCRDLARRISETVKGRSLGEVAVEASAAMTKLGEALRQLHTR